MTGDDIPYVRVFRGMIADYYDGVVDDEGMMNAMGLLARDDVAASLGMGVADSGERPLSDVLLDGVPGSDEPVEGDPTPIDPERARRLILKLTGIPPVKHGRPHMGVPRAIIARGTPMS